MLLTYTAKDGASIEYAHIQTESPRARLVVWPCGGGNARAYKLPRQRLNSLGIEILLYNPRGHGASTGEFSFPAAVADLKEILGTLPTLPLFGLGHSMGSGGLYMLHRELPLEFLWAVAPIFDSRKSLSYMYEQQTIHEFFELMGLQEQNLPQSLKNSSWMEESLEPGSELYRQLDFALPGAIRTGSLAELLRALFIPGHSMFDYLPDISDRLQVYVPANDNWFPQEETLIHCQAAGVRAQRVPEARNHFFSGAWHWLGCQLLDFFS